MKSKRVDVETRFPIVIRKNPVPIMGSIYNVSMTTDQIFDCLCSKATVKEILSNGSKLSLDLSNYDKDNDIDANQVDDNKKDNHQEDLKKPEDNVNNPEELGHTNDDQEDPANTEDLNDTNDSLENLDDPEELENDDIKTNTDEEHIDDLNVDLKSPVVQYNRKNKNKKYYR